MEDDTRAILARRHALAVGLALTGLACLVFAMLRVLDGTGWGYDFQAYYMAAIRLARGEGIYLPWTLEGPFSPGPYGLYLYAPPLAAAVLPFTMLSFMAATVAWFLLKVALLALACAVMPVRPTIRLLTFAVGAFSQPVLADVALGNVSLLVVVALAFTWRGLDRPMGSVAAALAMSVRPTLGVLLVWWAIRRRWRAVLATLIAGSLLIVATLPLVGTQAYLDYLTMLRNVTQVTGVPNNVDLASTVLRFSVDPAVATAALYTGYVVATGAMLVSLRHDRDLSFMVTISATTLLAPLLWDHYLASLLLPAAFLAHRGRMWGLALPLLAWLPAPLLPLLAIAGTLAPFLAERPPGVEPAAIDRPWWRRSPPAARTAVAPAPAPMTSAGELVAPTPASVTPGPIAAHAPDPGSVVVTSATASPAGSRSGQPLVAPLDASASTASNRTSSPG